MDDTPQTLPSFAPPAEPRRPAWEVVLLFTGLLALVVLFGWAQWASGTREKKFSGVRGVADARMGDRFAELATGARGPTAAALWKRAISSYREALTANPGLARARRGLAGALWLQGDTQAARVAMQGAVDLTALDPNGRRGWEAAQMAYGAAARPVNPGLLAEQRTVLETPALGWSRYPALMALAPDASARERYRARMAEEYGDTRLLRMMGLLTFAGMALIPFGIVLLGRGLKAPRRRLPEMPLSTRQIVVTFLVAFLILQAGGGIFGALAAIFGRGKGDDLLVAVVGAGAVGFWAAFAYIEMRLIGAGSRIGALGWRVREAWKWALGGYVAMFPLLACSFILVSLLMRAFPNVNTPDNPASDLVLAAHGWRLALVFLLVCVIAPISEEMLFRGLLFRGLAKRYGVLVGALASSLVFAGLHPQLPFGFPPLFVLAVGLCYVYRISGSLVPPILIHGLNNAIALTVTLALGGGLR